MSGIDIARGFSDAFTFGAAEIGWQKANRDFKAQGGLAGINEKAKQALTIKDQPGAGSNNPLPLAGDQTDTQVRARRNAAALQMITGRGRTSMFASGPLGNASVSNNTALGG